MTIQIENNGPYGDPDSPSNYSVKIKGREMCEFKHVRGDGLSKCLLRAAIAIEEEEARRLARTIVIQPSRLTPFVEALFSSGAVVLHASKKTNLIDEVGHSVSHSCCDLESLLRCLSEYKDKGGWEITKVSFLPFVSEKHQSKGQWVFERSSGYSGHICQKCAEWVYEDQALKCKCDKEN